MIPREKIDDVRERTNIVEVVKRHVELKRAGTASWKGLCPFHSERSPSFHVHESRQFFHCFGCGEHGDVLSFLTRIEQRPFMEVLRDLARGAGVDLPEKQLSPAERRAQEEQESERALMLRLTAAAAAFYRSQLTAPSAAEARSYLANRGISAEIAAQFQIGYAPAGPAALEAHLRVQGFPIAIAERLGLIAANERGTYDFFRDRVMLPVFDRQGRVVGFSGRLLDPDAKAAKYVNSPDSPLFHKKELLYGLPMALDSIRKGGAIVVVEGNFDVISLHQAGISEAVAPMGTALGVEQVTALGRLARRVILVFDSDDAGRRAARKVLPLFVEAGLDGRIVQVPSGKDPDEFIRKAGADAPELFRELMDGARPMVEQFIDDVAKEADATIPGRVKALEEAAPVLARVSNPTERELYAGRLAGALGLGVNQVMRGIRAVAAGGTGRRAKGASHAASGEATSAEAAAGAAEAQEARIPPRSELDAVVLLLAQPALGKLPEAARTVALLRDPGVRHLYANVLAAVESGASHDTGAWIAEGPADIRAAVSAALMEGRWDGVEGPERAMRALLGHLERARIDGELQRLELAGKEAVARGDSPAARDISQRKLELIRAKQGLTEGVRSAAHPRT